MRIELKGTISGLEVDRGSSNVEPTEIAKIVLEDEPSIPSMYRDFKVLAPTGEVRLGQDVMVVIFVPSPTESSEQN